MAATSMTPPRAASQIFLATCGAILSAGLSVFLISAQRAAAQKLPDVVPAPKGQTINMSLQTGSKSNLSFGTNTTFGSSLNSQFSPGTTVTSTSSFVPSEASITSSVGSGTTPGKTTASISNLRAEGTGNTTINGSPINANSANFASGNAILDGLGASVSIKLDPLQSKFTVQSAPNIVGSAACNPSVTTACKFTKDDGTKPYADIQVSSGSANASVNTSTTVDIGSSQFASSFAQSF